MTPHLQATIISIPILLWIIGMTCNPKSLKQNKNVKRKQYRIINQKIS